MANKVVSIDPANNKMIVDGGAWSGSDGSDSGEPGWNQDQTWSGGASGDYFGSRPATQIFDGNHDNYGASNATQGTLTWTSPVAFPAGSKVEVMGQTGGTATNTATVNGGAGQTVANGKVWTELTYTPGDEAQFVITMKCNTNANTNWTAIRINGQELVDTGVGGAPTPNPGATKVEYQTKGGSGTVVGVSGNDILINISNDRDERWIKGFNVAGPTCLKEPTLTADIELLSTPLTVTPTNPDLNPGVSSENQRFVWTINGVEQVGVNVNPWKPGNLETGTQYTVTVRHEDYSQQYLKSPESVSFSFTTGAARSLFTLLEDEIDAYKLNL